MTQNEENSNRLKGLLSDNGTLQSDDDYCERYRCHFFPDIYDEGGEYVELPSIPDDGPVPLWTADVCTFAEGCRCVSCLNGPQNDDAE